MRRLSFFPSPVDDESLYSVCARYHHLSGIQSAEISSNLLFGFRHAFTLRDVPCGLAFLKETAGAALPNIEEILRKMTVVGPFLSMMSGEQISKILYACGEQPGQRVRQKIKMNGHRYRVANSLKLCLLCASEDIENHGFSYWKTYHQFLGVWICPIHRVALSLAKGNAFERASWPFADVSNVQDYKAPLGYVLESDKSAANFLITVADAIRLLYFKRELKPETLFCEFVDCLYSERVIRSKVNIRAGYVIDWFHTRYPRRLSAGLRDFHGFESGRWIIDLIKSRRIDHPLQWAVLSACKGELIG